MTSARDSETENAAESDPLDSLSDQHRAFVLHYVTCWNATAAAKHAGYTLKNAHDTGYGLLRRPDVRAAISHYQTQLKATTDESLARLSRRARASMRDLVHVDPKSGDIRFDFKKAVDTGAIDAVKSLRPGPYGWSVSLHDSQAADIAILTDARNAGPKVAESQMPEGFDEALESAYGEDDTDIESSDDESEDDSGEEAGEFDMSVLLG